MIITFIRHGEKEDMGEDPYLTKKGIKQAKRLAKRLKKEKFDEFYCSDLNRAKQTAEIISKKMRIRPKIEKALNEFRVNVIKKSRSGWDNDEKKHYDSLITFLRKLSKKSDEKKSILIVAHGITNRIILSFFLDLDIKKSITFTQKETSINSIYWIEKFKNWRLTSWNDIHHVPERLR